MKCSARISRRGRPDVRYAGPDQRPGDPEAVERILLPGWLISGTNMLAVELHQAADGGTTCGSTSPCPPGRWIRPRIPEWCSTRSRAPARWPSWNWRTARTLTSARRIRTGPAGPPGGELHLSPGSLLPAGGFQALTAAEGGLPAGGRRPVGRFTRPPRLRGRRSDGEEEAAGTVSRRDRRLVVSRTRHARRGE